METLTLMHVHSRHSETRIWYNFFHPSTVHITLILVPQQRPKFAAQASLQQHIDVFIIFERFVQSNQITNVQR